MDASTFLAALGRCFAKSGNTFAETEGSGEWTAFMQTCLIDLADAQGLHMCARGLDRLPGVDVKRHMSKEFLFDFTLYRKDDWGAWSLPAVIVEHENGWGEAALMQDFWKVLVGYAPLRVMFGYASNQASLDKLALAVLRHAKEARWNYPPDATDLVLLRFPRLPWPEWRILHRRQSRDWSDLGAVVLKGEEISLPK